MSRVKSKKTQDLYFKHSFIVDFFLLLVYFSCVTPQELKNKVKQSRITIKELADFLRCTPQHLGAVLNGRAVLTENMEAVILNTLERFEKRGSSYSPSCWKDGGYITFPVRFSALQWGHLLSVVPDDVDLEEVLRSYALTLKASDFWIESEKMEQWQASPPAPNTVYPDPPYQRQKAAKREGKKKKSAPPQE